MICNCHLSVTARTIFNFHSKRQKRDVHPFETDTKGRHSSSLTFLLTGHLAEGGRPNFLTERKVTQIHLLRHQSVKTVPSSGGPERRPTLRSRRLDCLSQNQSNASRRDLQLLFQCGSMDSRHSILTPGQPVPVLAL